MMIAVTLNGVNYGVPVVVESLGLELGHDMYRFNPKPGHPSSIGSGNAAVAQREPDDFSQGRPADDNDPRRPRRDLSPTIFEGGAS